MGEINNLGIIGFGSIGKIHNKVIENKCSGLFKVIAIADINPEVKAAGVEFYTSYLDLIKKKEINSVSVNTPPNNHYQIVKEALKARKNVLVEKPPFLSSVEIKKMKILADKVGKTLFMAFHARYYGIVDKVKRELTGQKIEKIEILYTDYVLNYFDPSGWIFNPSISGGGVLIDSGINALSIVDYIFKGLRYKLIDARLVLRGKNKVESQAEIKFKFGENIAGSMKLNNMDPGPEKKRITFILENGTKYVLDIINKHLLKNGKVIAREKSGGGNGEDLESEYEGVYKDFSGYVNKKKSFVSYREIEFIEDIYKNAIYENEFI